MKINGLWNVKRDTKMPKIMKDTHHMMLFNLGMVKSENSSNDEKYFIKKN